MRRILAVLYGIICYVAFLGTFLYAIGFVAGIAVPKTIDSGPAGELLPSIAIDALLLGIFALQHSVMARPGFKKRWTRLIPQSIERSTYVLFASGTLALLFWQWRPLPSMVWVVEMSLARTSLWTLAGLGWFIVLSGSYMISHMHLFGLQQVTDYWKGRDLSFPRFQHPGYYRHVRHPLMLGFIIAFWATPEMSIGHLLFSVASTGYILVALVLEERDLIQIFGEKYRTYREEVPKLIPRIW